MAANGVVSVPIRGFNDFNLIYKKQRKNKPWFPSPYGVLMILIKQLLKLLKKIRVSVPIRGFNDFNI